MLNKSNKKPTSSVLEAAMEFMAVFGRDDAKLKALLKEMKEVQVHNEKVLQESQASVRESQKREDEIREKQSNLSDNIGEWNLRRVNAEIRFEKIKKEFESQFEKEKAEYGRKVRDLHILMKKADEDTTALNQDRDNMSMREDNLREGRRKLEISKQEHNAKRIRLESWMNLYKQL